MGSQFNTTGLYHPTGGWYYSGSERGYVNMFTGERMSYNNFNQKIMPSFTSPDHTLYGDDAVMAGYDLLGYKREYFGSDHLGSQEWGVLSPVGKYTIYKKPFWEVTGSYYNHEYFLSGVEAYGDAGFVLRLITNRLDDSALIPAGYSWELNSSAEFYGAVSSSPIGILLVLRGQDAVSIRNFRSAGLGGGLAGASIQLLKTRYHYFGDINNFSLENTFYGRSFDFEFSAGHLGIIAGSSISIMFNATHHGEFLIGVGVYAGLGTPGISFSGTYQGTDKW